MSRAQLKAGSQAEKVLGYLATGRPLTVWQAICWWKCTTLSQRCTELKKRGHRIHSEMVKRGNKRVAQYTLERH